MRLSGVGKYFETKLKMGVGGWRLYVGTVLQRREADSGRLGKRPDVSWNCWQEYLELRLQVRGDVRNWLSSGT